jgi:hypothetical protein
MDKNDSSCVKTSETVEKTDLHHRIPDLAAVAGRKIPAPGSKTSQQPLESLHPLEKSFQKNPAES